MKSISTYWNTLSELDKWEEIEGSEGNLTQLTISEDPETGDYTRLTKFKGGYNTQIFGAKDHEYPEEIFIVYGRVYDEAVGVWLEQGTYFPIKADLYLRSGKMAKEAWFTKGLREGETRVVAMILNDQIQTNQKTVIEYKEIVATEIDDKYYNPAYLSRTKNLDL